jgi:hypothetical protein
MKKHPLLFAFVVILMGVIGVGVSVTERQKARDRTAWEAFKVAHHCEAASHELGVPYKSVTYGPRNEVYVAEAITAPRTGWRCDDGVTRVVDDNGAASSFK